MVLSASPPQPTISFLLDQIADELSQDQNLMRIKKLLLYVCTGTWETDRDRLKRFTLRLLLQHLFERCLTFEQLQQRLNQVTVTLNKSDEYRLIANTVISHFYPLYAEPQAELPQPPSCPNIYQIMAQQLMQQPNQTRVKKLLLLTCRNIWESNPVQLEQLDLVLLLQELYEIAPALSSLEVALHQVATALSKPEEYIAVAKQIVILLEPLYQETSLHRLPLVLSSSIQSEFADVLASQPLQPHQAVGLDQQVQSHSSGQDQLKQAPLNIIQTEPPLAAMPNHRVVTKSALKVLSLAKSPELPNLFDLRLTLMRDTNPLRAKILLFSLLHELFRAEHEAFLKTHELDELLRILFLSYRVYSEVATELRQTAQALGVAADYLQTDYLQTAEAILKAIQPFYGELSVNAPPDRLTEIASTKVDLHTVS